MKDCGMIASSLRTSLRVGRHVAANVLRHSTIELRRSLFSLVDNKVLISFPQLYFVQQFRFVESPKHRLPDEDCDVLSCRWSGLEVRDVFIDVHVVEWLHDCIVHHLLQIRQIHHHSSFTVNWTSNRNLDNIIVAVSVNIVALSEDFAIFIR